MSLFWAWPHPAPAFLQSKGYYLISAPAKSPHPEYPSCWRWPTYLCLAGFMMGWTHHLRPAPVCGLCLRSGVRFACCCFSAALVSPILLAPPSISLQESPAFRQEAVAQRTFSGYSASGTAHSIYYSHNSPDSPKRQWPEHSTDQCAAFRSLLPTFAPSPPGSWAIASFPPTVSAAAVQRLSLPAHTVCSAGRGIAFLSAIIPAVPAFLPQIYQALSCFTGNPGWEFGF